jgi:hypothetical protein
VFSRCLVRDPRAASTRVQPRRRAGGKDAGGNTIYNLAQQDMVALRGVMRLGFALPNPINRLQPVAASRAPFSVLTA